MMGGSITPLTATATTTSFDPSSCSLGYAVYQYYPVDKTLKRVTNACKSTGGARSTIKVNPNLATQLGVVKSSFGEARFMVCCKASSTSFPYSF